MTDKNENIAVIGAGICGLCTALALSGKGYRVTVYERDIPPPEGDVDRAFFEWQRRGAAQFRHPHAFLAVMCNLMQQYYPDLVEQFWEAGARKVTFHDMLPDQMRAGYQPKPGDEEMWLLMCRRATMETVLRRYVESRPGVTVNNQNNIVGMEANLIGGEIAVKGVRIQIDRGETQTIFHDVVVDASGANSRFPGWLSDLGATIEVEDDDAEIVYYTRHFKLKPGEKEPPRTGKDRSAGDLGYIKFGVFPGDNGHFAVILCLPNHETELREAVKDPDRFNQICCTIPGLYHWVNPEKSAPTTDSFGFGNIHAVWKHFVKDGRPVARGYFAVGDAAIRTNPLYGRGCSTGIIHAHLLADLLDEIDDPVERALEFDLRTEDRLRPIFAMSLREDKQGIDRAKTIFEGRSLDDKKKGFKPWLRASLGDAIAGASREHLHVLRGAMRSFNLMEKPGDFLKNPRIRWTVLRYMLRGRERNNRARFQRGPKRDEMLRVITGKDAEAA